MRPILTILLVVAMVVPPVHQWASGLGCGCTHTSEVERSGVETGCCQPAASEDGHRDHDRDGQPSPCDPEHCPSSCCSVTLANAFVPPVGTGVVMDSPVLRAMTPSERLACSPPHLLRLKRPPRFV